MGETERDPSFGHEVLRERARQAECRAEEAEAEVERLTVENQRLRVVASTGARLYWDAIARAKRAEGRAEEVEQLRAERDEYAEQAHATKVALIRDATEQITAERDDARENYEHARWAIRALGELRAGIEELRDDSPFLGSVSLSTMIWKTLEAHVIISEPDADEPYVWCGCGWRSSSTEFAGRETILHLTNVLHAAVVPVIAARFRRDLDNLLGGQKGVVRLAEPRIPKVGDEVTIVVDGESRTGEVREVSGDRQVVTVRVEGPGGYTWRPVLVVPRVDRDSNHPPEEEADR